MTALQELSLIGRVELEAKGVVQSLEQLIVQHSLAKIVPPDKLAVSIAQGNQLPCEWLPAPTDSTRLIRFF